MDQKIKKEQQAILEQIRSASAQVSGKRAKAEGAAAEREFDQCEAIWRAKNEAMFYPGDPKTKIVKSGDVTKVIQTEVGCVDRIGVVHSYAAFIEIKTSKRKWRAPVKLKSWINEMLNLQKAEQTGAFAGVLILERTPKRQWYLLRIRYGERLPHRSEWIELELIDLPRIIKAIMKRGKNENT